MSDQPHFLFLRAINVGKRRVHMDSLRTLLEGAGFTGVLTHLQTGNVIVHTSPYPPETIEKTCEELLQSHYGFAIPVYRRTADELSSIYNEALAVLPEDPMDSLYITFFKRHIPRIDPLPLFPNRTIRIVRILGTTALTQTSPITNSTSFPNPFLERVFDCEATSRNFRVVEALLGSM